MLSNENVLLYLHAAFCLLRHGEHQTGVLCRQGYNHAECIEGVQSGMKQIFCVDYVYFIM